MKKEKTILVLVGLITLALTSCEKKDYPDGLPEYENYYYAGFLPWNNKDVASVSRSQTELIKFPVEFHSAFVRDYDAEARYSFVSTGITDPAVVGQDFEIVDKNGNAIQPSNGAYSLVFPQAKAKIDTIYVKVLNNPAEGIRKIEIDLVKNQSTQYTVGTFSQAFQRFVEIK